MFLVLTIIASPNQNIPIKSPALNKFGTIKEVIPKTVKTLIAFSKSSFTTGQPKNRFIGQIGEMRRKA